MKMSMSEVGNGPSPHALLGALMVQLGLLDAREVEQVLLHQQRERLPFGEAAVQLDLVSEADMAYALARQFRYTYVRQGAGGAPVAAEVVAAHRPFSPEADQMRSIRSQLLLRWYDKARKRNALAVVGAQPGEGRSWFAANLATVFAQAGERTLLLDANLRSPMQHALFGLPARSGLSTVLMTHRVGDAIVPVRELPGLSVLPAGPRPPNALELLGRASFGQLLEQLRGSFDCVVIDTAPLSASEEAAFVALHAGAALTIARTGLTKVPVFSRMQRGLENAGVKVVGSVWNDVPRPRR